MTLLYSDWQKKLIDFCNDYFEKVKTDYEIYCKAFDDGEINFDEGVVMVS